MIASNVFGFMEKNYKKKNVKLGMIKVYLTVVLK